MFNIKFIYYNNLNVIKNELQRTVKKLEAI